MQKKRKGGGEASSALQRLTNFQEHFSLTMCRALNHTVSLNYSIHCIYLILRQPFHLRTESVEIQRLHRQQNIEKTIDFYYLSHTIE